MNAGADTMPAVFGWQPSLLALGAALVLLLIVWLALRLQGAPRKESANRVARREPGVIGRAVRAQARSALELMRHLSTTSRWRYQIPWVLMIGDRDSGNTEVMDSVVTGQRTQQLAREKGLVIEGTDWSFFDRGIVIDAVGQVARDDAEERDHWSFVLDALNRHRPERPLDAIVLGVSAHTLLHTDAPALEKLQRELFRKLWEVQKRLEFTLPVYVLVTRCELIPGFEPFWSAQPADRRGEIVGWSNPHAVDSNFTAEWVDTAFEDIARALKSAQLAVASGEDAIGDMDDFFLFPQRFESLRGPLRALLARVLDPSIYQSSLYLRGIYFCGALEADAAQPGDAPDSRVAFVDDLFSRKIFAERNLAQPTRLGMLSRNRYLRGLQVASTGALLALVVWLGFAWWHADRQADRYRDTVDGIRREVVQSSGEWCPASLAAEPSYRIAERHAVYQILEHAAAVDLDLSWRVEVPLVEPWIRWSSEREITRSGMQAVTDYAFGHGVLPSIACRVIERAGQVEARARDRYRALPSSVGGGGDPQTADPAVGQVLRTTIEAVQEFGDELAGLQGNRYTFRSLAQPDTEVSALDRKQGLAWLEDLLRWLYDEPPPKAVAAPGSPVGEMVARAGLWQAHRNRLDERLRRTDGDLARLVRDFAERGSALIDATVGEGGALVDALEQSGGELVDEAARFTEWLAWVERNWTGAERGPCRAFERALLGTAESIEQAAARARLDPGPVAAELRKQAQSLFSAESCVAPSVAKLSRVRLAGSGALFSPVSTDGGRALAVAPSAQASADTRAYQQLSRLGFMQVMPRNGFSCRAGVDGWDDAVMREAIGFITEYLEFRESLGDAPAASAQDRVARERLARVLADAMYRAQQVASPRASTDSLYGDELALARQSMVFARTWDQVVFAADLHRQAGLDPQPVIQCARRFASAALDRVTILTQASDLYTIAMRRGDGRAPDATLFVAPGAAALKAYLARELKRAQVLAGHASPFVAFLANTEGLGNAAAAGDASAAYWSATEAAADAAAGFGATRGEVAALHALFTDVLATITPANCASVLDGHPFEPPGDGLFAERRIALREMAELLCADRGRAVALEEFNAVRQGFSELLAGRYPFGPRTAPDASALAVRGFFANHGDRIARLDEQLRNGELDNSLSGMSARLRRDLASFVTALAKARGFFDAALGDGRTAAPLSLTPGFRAYPRQSPGSEQVLRWRLATGSGAVVWPPGGKALEWSPGERITLSLRWAERSPQAPVADPAQADLAVSGREAAFTAAGAWALLRFVDAHPTTGPVTSDPLRGDRVLLQFRVPVATARAGEPAAPGVSLFYLTLDVAGVDAKTGAPAALSLPRTFPSAAPEIW